MLPFLVPLGVIPGLLLASVVYLTGSVYLDMLLFCLMTFAGVFVVALLFLLLVPEKGEQAVNIRFTRGGMENTQKTAFYLLILPGSKKFKTAALSKQIGSAQIGRASCRERV